MAPISFSSSCRASVPIRLSRSPLSPITIALWPSRSTTMVAAIFTMRPCFGLGSSSNLSITTVDVYGSSSPVNRNSFSRTVSLARNFSLRSVSSSCAYHQGCSGRYFSQMPNRRSTSLALLADIGTNSVKAWRCCISCSQGAMSPRRCTSSSLLATSSAGIPGLSSASTLASAGRNLPASTTNSTRSTSPTAPNTVLLSDLFRAVLCLVWNPGVSTKTNCAAPTVRMPVIRCRVVCALLEVMLIFCPTSALSRVDLPTFGLPTMAIRPQRWPAATPAGGWPGRAPPAGMSGVSGVTIICSSLSG